MTTRSRAPAMHPDHTEAEWQDILDSVRAEVEATIGRGAFWRNNAR